MESEYKELYKNYKDNTLAELMCLYQEADANLPGLLKQEETIENALKLVVKERIKTTRVSEVLPTLILERIRKGEIH